MTTTKLLSLTLLLAATMGICGVSSAEEVKDSTSTEIVSAKDSDLRNEDALRVAVGDFDDVEFLLSAEDMEAIADNVYISFNGVSAKGGEGSGSSSSSAEVSGQVEATENSSTTFSGALTLASKTTTSDAVTTGVSSVAMSLSSDKSTEQYATVDAGKSYYEQVSTSNSGSAVTTYSATSFLGNSNSVGDGDGSYGISPLAGIIEDPITPTVTTRKWVGGSAAVGSTSYNWSTGANWNSGSWSNGDNATFGSEGSAYSTVTVDTEIIVAELTVSGDYTFEYSTDASLTVTGIAIITSESYTSTLTINGGETTFNGDCIYIGELGGKGAITILGSDTVVTFETQLLLGYGFDASSNYSEGEIIIGSLDDTGNGPYVAFKNGNSSYSGLYIGGSLNNTGKITINSGTTIFDTAVYLAYGNSSTGTLTINGGNNTFNNYVYVGYENGSTGTITIEGGETTFGDYTCVGYYGTGEMTITDGKNTFSGEVDVGYYDEGYVTISGGENTFSGGSLWIGCYATGEMTITGGETTFSGTNTYVGYEDKGTITIEGGTNTFSGGDLYIGYSSTGEMTISGDDTVVRFDGSQVYVGGSDSTSGNGTLTITDGTNTFSGNTYIGYKGTGEMTITGGETTFSGTYTEVGYKGTGEMTISGDDTVVRFDGSQVYVGDGANSIGTITIEGGTTTFGDKVYLGYSSNSAGTITINGGTTTFEKDVCLGHNSNGSTGTITIEGGKNTFKGEVYVGYGGKGYVTISSGTNTFSGSLYIGSSGTGEMTITGGSTTLKGASTIGDSGSLSVSGGTLTIEKQIGTSQTGSVTFSASGKLIVTQTLLATAGELKEGETAAVAVITANTITFGNQELSSSGSGSSSSGSGYVTDLVSSHISAQSGTYRVIDWYYYANNGTLYAIVTMPEPSMFGLMFGFASVGLVATRRRRRVA